MKMDRIEMFLFFTTNLAAMMSLANQQWLFNLSGYLGCGNMQDCSDHLPLSLYF